MVDATVTVVDRGRLRDDINLKIEGEVLATAENENPDAVITEDPVMNWVIDHPEGTILVDTGSHPRGMRGYWPEEYTAAFLHEDAHEHHLDDDLEAVGYSLDDIDAVLQTHLHVDYAGGLYHFAGTDTPVFVHEEELKWAYYSTKGPEGSTGYYAEDFEHDLNWEILHRERERHFENLEFLHVPGHTPGTVGWMIHLEETTAIFTSDLTFLRTNYHDEVPLGAGLLTSREDWYDSVRRLKDLERRHDAAVFTGHDIEDFERLKDGLP